MGQSRPLSMTESTVVANLLINHVFSIVATAYEPHFGQYKRIVQHAKSVIIRLYLRMLSDTFIKELLLWSLVRADGLSSLND